MKVHTSIDNQWESVIFPPIVIAFGTDYSDYLSLFYVFKWSLIFVCKYNCHSESSPHIFLHKWINSFKKHKGKLQRIKEIQACGPQGGMEEVTEKQCICSFTDLENHLLSRYLVLRARNSEMVSQFCVLKGHFLCFALIKMSGIRDWF